MAWCWRNDADFFVTCKGPSRGQTLGFVCGFVQAGSAGRRRFFCDNRGVVRAFYKGEVNCICAGHNDADLWIFGLEQSWWLF